MKILFVIYMHVLIHSCMLHAYLVKGHGERHVCLHIWEKVPCRPDSGVADCSLESQECALRSLVGISPPNRRSYRVSLCSWGTYCLIRRRMSAIWNKLYHQDLFCEKGTLSQKKSRMGIHTSKMFLMWFQIRTFWQQPLSFF